MARDKISFSKMWKNPQKGNKLFKRNRNEKEGNSYRYSKPGKGTQKYSNSFGLETDMK